ncbi:MAG: hypothetical protein MUD08_00605 [Cytophagales bacterium]|jgi:hypothetical protein|nr:hypothetical protein [Cytophagales bacterium]
MRQTILSLLVMAVLLQSFGSVGVFVSFKLNQGYIAAKLCENRAKPKMRCNGKCYLAKKLKQAEQQQQADNQKSKAELNWICEAFSAIFAQNAIQPSVLHHTAFHICSLPSGNPGGCFHPPSVA